MTDYTAAMQFEQQGMRKIRLSAWARNQGISRLTAYRMLKRGILPVPTERSPTGRWYILLPANKAGKIVIYSRADPKSQQIEIINRQVASLAEWASLSGRSVFTVVKEMADPRTGPMPRLEKLLADLQVTEILIEHPSVLGICQYQLLVAALAPQGRRITAIPDLETQAKR